MSTEVPGARAHAADANVNQATPTANIRRRPNRSPNEPPTSSRAARARVYPFTTHWSWATRAWNSRPMVGRAMPTTVASTDAMPDPSTVAATTQRPARDR